MTDAVIFKNNASSRLGIDIPAASITITVEPGTGIRFPSPAAAQFFPVIVNDRRTGQFEIMYCTQRVNDILTVTRAQEGTAAQNFLLGASVWSTATAGTFQTYFNYSWSKDEADARFVNAAGDVMTGALTLPGNPTIGKHATTKEWVEALVLSVTTLTEAPNDGQPYARQSIGWVVSVTRAAYDANNVAISNAFAADDADIAALQAAMLLRPVDAPNDANIYARSGAAWVQTVTKATYDAYVTSNNAAVALRLTDAPNDANSYLRSAAAWVMGVTKATYDAFVTATNNALALRLTDAPSDGSTYGRKNAAWSVTAAGLPEAPSDGSLYGRVNAAWVKGVKLAGDTMTGLLVLSGDPAAALGAVTKQYADLRALIASPTFTGVPAAPTAGAGTSTTQIATTAFVTTADNLKANIASPTLTGVPAAPTAAPGDNTTQLATTAYATAADAVVTTAISSTTLVAQGRLSLTTGLAVTTADVIGGATLFYVPYVGKNISLYSGTAWVNRSIGAQISLALLGLLANAKPHDVFIFDNAGTPTLEVFAWTNDTARATALVLQDGVWCKTGALTRRYVGTIYATGTGTTEDSLAKRFVWNMNNRVNRPMSLFDPVDSYTYASATIRQMNGSVTNQLDFVRGLDEDRVEAEALLNCTIGTANDIYNCMIGLDSATTKAPASLAGIIRCSAGGANEGGNVVAKYRGLPGLGRHFLTVLEGRSAGTGTITVFGDNGGLYLQSGILGSSQG